MVFGMANEPGLTLVPTNIRFRDGSFSNFNNTDLNGNAGFNEVFPLFSWYVVETDTTRYKNTGTHVVYDAGGPADGTCTSTTAPCGTSNIGQIHGEHVRSRFLCPPTCGCRVRSIATTRTAPGSRLRLAAGEQPAAQRLHRPHRSALGCDRGLAGLLRAELASSNSARSPTRPARTAASRGHVVYASTRPFDDPQLLLQLSWEPLVPDVTINLYQEGTAAGWQPIPHVGRHHQDQQFGRLGAGLPVRWHSQHELPGPVRTLAQRSVLLLAVQPAELAGRVQQRRNARSHAAEQLPVQVL